MSIESLEWRPSRRAEAGHVVNSSKVGRKPPFAVHFRSADGLRRKAKHSKGLAHHSTTLVATTLRSPTHDPADEGFIFGRMGKIVNLRNRQNYRISTGFCAATPLSWPLLRKPICRSPRPRQTFASLPSVRWQPYHHPRMIHRSRREFCLPNVT